MKRLGTVLVVIALTPLIMGGGMNPGSQIVTEKITGPSVSGVLIVDTHNGSVATPEGPDDTQATYVRSHDGQFEEATKHKFAAMSLRKGGASASAIFRLPIAFRASAGCDVSRTDDRFVYSTEKPNRLRNIMPPGLVDALFTQLGMDLAASGLDPVITDVSNAICTPDPDNTAETNPGLTNPGILSMQVVIQFIIP